MLCFGRMAKGATILINTLGGGIAVADEPYTSVIASSIVVTSAGTPVCLPACACRAVWIGPTTSNTATVLFGTADVQNRPLLKTDLAGLTLPVDNPAKIAVKAVVGGDGIEYQIFS